MRYLSIIFSLFMTLEICAQKLTISQQLEDFDLVVQTVEADYAGFTTKVNAKTDSRYKSVKATLRKQVEHGKRDGVDAAAEYIGWFGDMHLHLVKDGLDMTHQYMPSTKLIPYQKTMEYQPSPTACKVTDSTFLIRFPSCDGDPSLEWVEQSLQSYLQSGCANLIIDIRGNRGGQDQYYEPYLKLLYDHPGKVDGTDFYNSAANREAVVQLVENMDEKPEWMTSFVTRLRTEPDNCFVSWVEDHTLEYDSVYQLPVKAAIIIDKHVASSGEQMLLDIRATSSRTTIYGRDNSMGCIDFSNVRPAATLPWSKATLEVPITRSHRVPDRGVDETGIAPDERILISLPKSLNNNVDEWVEWVAKELEK